MNVKACLLFVCTTYGNRTRDSSVKGRRLNPLTNAAHHFRIANVGCYFIFPKKYFHNLNFY